MIECGDDAEGAAAALRLKRKEIGACVPGIDFALEKPLGFERRDAMAEVAARGGEGLGELRGLDGPGGFKEKAARTRASRKPRLSAASTREVSDSKRRAARLTANIGLSRRKASMRMEKLGQREARSQSGRRSLAVQLFESNTKLDWGGAAAEIVVEWLY